LRQAPLIGKKGLKTSFSSRAFSSRADCFLQTRKFVEI